MNHPSLTVVDRELGLNWMHMHHHKVAAVIACHEDNFAYATVVVEVAND